MQESEFDKFADEYHALHARNIRLSGEDPEYFAEYKIAALARLAAGLGLPAESAVLDFGAGVGSSVPHLRKHLPASRITCLDVSRKSLELGRGRHGDEADFVEFDGATIPFADGHFDVVFAACVFHHIPHGEHDRLLAEFRRVLRPGGLALIFEHNPYNPLTVRAVDTCPFDENAVLIRPSALRDRFATAGFRDPTLDFRVFFPGPLRWLRPIEAYMTWLPLGAQYSVHGRKP